MPSRLLVPPRQALWKPQGPLALDVGHPLVVGLRHAYPMNEGGGLAFNLVRPSESISLGAGVTWSRNSQYGVVLNFNNSTTGRAVLSSTFTPAATVFSVDMLVRVAVTPAANNFEYLFGSASAGGNGIMLTNATTTPKGWDIDTSTADLAVGSLPTNNIWYHLVFVYVSTSSATIYQNGLNVASGGLAGTISFPLGWLGADGTNASNNFGGDIGWLRVWDRALNQADVTSLYADPFEMFISGREKATQFAIVGSSPAPGYSPLASVLTAASPPLVAPWPPRSAFMSSASSNIVSGSATIIGNSLLAESALVVSPSDPAISNSLLTESALIISPSGDAEIASSALVESSALVLAPATEISNSAVVESAAAILAPATEIANSLLTDAAQVVSNGDTLISNATVAEAAQLVETTSDSAIEQGNAAIVESVGQVVDPALAIVANSLLVVTGNIAGQGGGTLIANAALAETAAQLLVPAAQQSSAVLAQTAARILVVATLQANALLAITGSVIGLTNYPQPTGALASVNIPTASASGTQPGASVASNTPTGTKG